MNDEIEIEPGDLSRPPSQGNPKNYWAEKRNLILIGAGVLIVVLIFFFFRVSGKDKSTETLAQREQKLAAIEQKIAVLEKQKEDLLASGPVKSLAEKVEMLEKRPTEKPQSPASPKAQAAPPAKRYHKVKKGETLTGIAKRYGLSVKELRRMNKLSPKTTLAVNQKLIVSPGGKN